MYWSVRPEQGFNRCLVVLTQPADYRKGVNELLPLMRIVLHKYPKLIEAMETRHIRYNDQVAEVRKDEKEGTVFVLCPEQSLNIGRTEKDASQLRRVYEEGRKVALAKLSEIKSFLDE